MPVIQSGQFDPWRKARRTTAFRNEKTGAGDCVPFARMPMPLEQGKSATARIIGGGHLIFPRVLREEEARGKFGARDHDERPRL
jgi:hypothetical protein